MSPQYIKKKNYDGLGLTLVFVPNILLLLSPSLLLSFLIIHMRNCRCCVLDRIRWRVFCQAAPTIRTPGSETMCTALRPCGPSAWPTGRTQTETKTRPRPMSWNRLGVWMDSTSSVRLQYVKTFDISPSLPIERGEVDERCSPVYNEAGKIIGTLIAYIQKDFTVELLGKSNYIIFLSKSRIYLEIVKPEETLAHVDEGFRWYVVFSCFLSNSQTLESLKSAGILWRTNAHALNQFVLTIWGTLSGCPTIAGKTWLGVLDSSRWRAELQ